MRLVRFQRAFGADETRLGHEYPKDPEDNGRSERQDSHLCFRQELEHLLRVDLNLLCFALRFLVPDVGNHIPWFQFFAGFSWLGSTGGLPLTVAVGLFEFLQQA